MAEELEKLWANLSIRYNESLRIVVPLLPTPATQHKGSLCLLSKIISLKPVNMEALVATLKGVWNPPHGLSHTVVGDNIVLFRFFHPADKARVLLGSPCVTHTNIDHGYFGHF